MTIIWMFFFVKLKKLDKFSAIFDMFDDVFEIDFDDRNVFDDRENSNVFFFYFFFDFDESDRFVKNNDWKEFKNNVSNIEFWEFFSFWTRKPDIYEKIDFCCSVSRDLNNFRNFFDFQSLVFFWRWFCWYWRCGKEFRLMNFMIFELFESKKSFTMKKSIETSELYMNKKKQKQKRIVKEMQNKKNLFDEINWV